MNVHVEQNRFLSVACEPGERIVFDRKETRYHLLRDSAARLWDEIGEGGTFELAPTEPDAEDPVSLLMDAGLVEPAAAAAQGVTRRVWLRRTGKASAAAIVLPLVATISAPQLALGQGPSLDEQTDINSSTTQFEPQVLAESPQTLTREERRQQRLDARNEETTNQDSNSGTRTRTRTRRRNRDG